MEYCIRYCVQNHLLMRKCEMEHVRDRPDSICGLNADSMRTQGMDSNVQYDLLRVYRM